MLTCADSVAFVDLQQTTDIAMAFVRSMTQRLRKREGDGPLRRALRQLDPVDSSRRLEEETLLDYQRHEFFPVFIGMTLKERYEVLAKLGWGSGSTVWFCKDQLWVMCWTR